MAARTLRLDDIRKWLPLATLAVLVLVVGVAQPSFLEPSTLIELASDTAVLFILATGVTFVIMLGGIDLSIQSMASLASVIVALTVARLGYGSFVLAIAIGAIAGLLSGIVHVRLKIPSFIATLAMGGVLFSAALVISKERSITLDEAGRAYQAWITGEAFGLPNVIIVGLIVLAAAHTLQAHTRFGRYSAAIGAGEPAAYASGVKVGRQKIIRLHSFGGLRRARGGRPRRPPGKRLADLGGRAPAAFDRRRRRRGDRDNWWRRQHLAHARRRADHFRRAHRHDISRAWTSSLRTSCSARF